MKVSGLTWEEAQLRFEAAGLPSSRTQVWRYLVAAGVRPKIYTPKTRRLPEAAVQRVIGAMIQKGGAR